MGYNFLVAVCFNIKFQLELNKRFDRDQNSASTLYRSIRVGLIVPDALQQHTTKQCFNSLGAKSGHTKYSLHQEADVNSDVIGAQRILYL